MTEEVATEARSAAPRAKPARQTAGSRPRSGSSRPPGRQFRGRGYYRPRRRICNVDALGWKEFNYLKQFLTPSGSIQSRRKTGACAKFQRRLAVEVKRARYMALIPYSSEQARLLRSGGR